MHISEVEQINEQILYFSFSLLASPSVFFPKTTGERPPKPRLPPPENWPSRGPRPRHSGRPRGKERPERWIKSYNKGKLFFFLFFFNVFFFFFVGGGEILCFFFLLGEKWVDGLNHDGHDVILVIIAKTFEKPQTIFFGGSIKRLISEDSNTMKILTLWSTSGLFRNHLLTGARRTADNNAMSTMFAELKAPDQSTQKSGQVAAGMVFLQKVQLLAQASGRMPGKSLSLQRNCFKRLSDDP